MFGSSLHPVACMMVDVFLCLCMYWCPTRLACMSNLVDVTCEFLGSPPVLSEVRVAQHSSVLCVVCALLVFTLCVLCPMLPLSPDFPLLIEASGFSNVYVGGAYRNLLSHDIIRKANGLLHQA